MTLLLFVNEVAVADDVVVALADVAAAVIGAISKRLLATTKLFRGIPSWLITVGDLRTMNIEHTFPLEIALALSWPAILLQSVPAALLLGFVHCCCCCAKVEGKMLPNGRTKAAVARSPIPIIAAIIEDVFEVVIIINVQLEYHLIIVDITYQNRTLKSNI